ncbi:TIM-barrel domain-containing protein, partial [Veillonella sp. ZSJB6]
GLDPLWMLNHYHAADIARDGDRPIIFSRYSGPGSHRYPVGFSGDTLISWASLAFQPYFTATASNIGYGWWSHDIGGHYRGSKD